MKQLHGLLEVEYRRQRPFFLFIPPYILFILWIILFKKKQNNTIRDKNKVRLFKTLHDENNSTFAHDVHTEMHRQLH